ncbi:MAG: hypothetical protein LBM67_06510 [Lentimicrobiaceae bacterium]|jgi:flagellar hook-basal body complex protein FliE|nr:hypothetical protein [Lentimicrobiaceae bacterium]
MKINHQNYEAYLLDYLEGLLSTEDTELLKAFVESHSELGTWEMLTNSFDVLPMENLVFENKKSLYQAEINSTETISESNYEETFIAYHECLLNEKEQNEVIDFVTKNKALENEFQLYKKIKFQPETTIVFEQKERLHRKLPAITLWNRGIAVAASIVLLIGFGLLFQTKQSVVERDQLARLPNLEIRKIDFIESSDREQKIRIAENTIGFIAEEATVVVATSRQVLAAIPTLIPAVYQEIELTDIAAIQYTQPVEKMYFYFDTQAFLATNNAIEKERKRSDSFVSNLKNQIHNVSNRIIRAKIVAEEQILNSNGDNLIRDIAHLGSSVFTVFSNKDDEK